MLKVLKPTVITPATLISSDAPEADNPAYSAATTYALADKVMYEHRNYESLQASNNAHTPTDPASAWWLDLGPTNRWAMFDTYINTGTSYDTTPGAFKATVQPGITTAVALLDISNASSVSVKMVNGSTTVYDQTINLDDSIITDWYSYWFDPFDIKSDVLFTGLPVYYNGQITVTVTPSVPGATVSLGAAMFGTIAEIGQVQYGATSEITDYSKKSTDDFGVTTLIQRSYAKRTTYTLELENTELRRVYSILAALRATPAVWVASDLVDLSILTVFGYYKDFSINVAYPTYSTYSLEIEGMI